MGSIVNKPKGNGTSACAIILYKSPLQSHHRPPTREMLILKQLEKPIANGSGSRYWCSSSHNSSSSHSTANQATNRRHS